MFALHVIERLAPLDNLVMLSVAISAILVLVPSFLATHLLQGAGSHAGSSIAVALSLSLYLYLFSLSLYIYISFLCLFLFLSLSLSLSVLSLSLSLAQILASFPFFPRSPSLSIFLALSL